MILEQIMPRGIRRKVNGYTISKNTVGMSPAKVFQLTRGNDVLYLKASHKKYEGTTFDVKREKDVLVWLTDKISVPRVIQYEETDDHRFLLMDEVKGRMTSSVTIAPKRVVEIYAESICRLQSIDISQCPFNSGIKYRLSELDYLLKNNLAAVGDFYEGEVPFSQPEELVVYLKTNMDEEDLVFSHEDICDSNIIISKDSQDINGYIDWGRGGKADRWYDIAFCVRSIREDLSNEDYIKYFFDLLGIEPDWAKITYYLWLDELF